jgi:hypothetical protein
MYPIAEDARILGYLTPKHNAWITIISKLKIIDMILIDLIPMELPIVNGYWHGRFKKEPLRNIYIV